MGADETARAARLREATRRFREVLGECSEVERRQALSEVGDAAFAGAGPRFGEGDPYLLPDVLQNVPGSVFQYLLHPDGRHEIPFLSGGVSALTGLSAREVLDDPSFAFSRVHPDDLPQVQASIQRSAETLDTWNCTYRIRHLDGSIRWALGIGSPRRLPSGAVLWTTVNVDITAQKDAEQAARERGELLRAVFEAPHVCLALLGPDGTILQMNGALEALADAKTSGVTRRIGELPGLAEPERIVLELARARSGERIESEIRLFDGDSRRAFRTSLSPVGRAEDPDGTVLLEAVEITAMRDRDRLEQLMAVVARVVALGGFAVQRDRVRLHDSSRELLGVGRREWSIEGFVECLGASEDADDVAGGLRAVLAGDRDHWTRDISTPSGRWLRVYAAAQGSRSDDPPLVLGAIQDVTQQRAEETELRHAQRLDALGRLAGGVAHDFNNLLTAIMGSAELLSDDVAESGRVLLDEIGLAASLGKAMTQRLLTVARKQPSKPETVDLAKHLAESLPLWRRMVGEHVELHLAAAAPEHWVKFDPRQLDQVIMNLVLNARDASAPGSRIQVTLEEAEPRPPGPRGADCPEGWHRVAVIDGGHGMDAETARRAVDPFFTTKGGGGTGLGLSTCHAIVRQSGGHLRIETAPGAGTTVTVWLPRHRPSPESGEREAAASPPAASLIVLVVEDDARVRRVVSRMLRRCGHEVRPADGVDEALRIVADEEVGLVLSDVVMPDVSGPDLVARLRRIRPGLPALLMSGYPGAEMERLGMAVEDSLLPKPFTLVDLKAKLAELIPAAGRAGDGEG